MTHYVKFALLYVSLVVLFSNCSLEVAAQSPAKQPVFDSAKAIQEIAAQNKIFSDALRKSDSIQAASTYTQDAQILTHGSPSTIGRAAVVSFYGGMIRNGITRFSYTTTGVWGSDNNVVVEDGILSFAFLNGKVAAKGRYLLIWKRENGLLKIFRDTFFSDGKMNN